MEYVKGVDKRWQRMEEATFDNIQLVFGQFKDLILSSDVGLSVIRSGHGFESVLSE